MEQLLYHWSMDFHRGMDSVPKNLRPPQQHPLRGYQYKNAAVPVSISIDIDESPYSSLAPVRCVSKMSLSNNHSDPSLVQNVTLIQIARHRFAHQCDWLNYDCRLNMQCIHKLFIGMLYNGARNLNETSKKNSRDSSRSISPDRGHIPYTFFDGNSQIAVHNNNKNRKKEKTRNVTETKFHIHAHTHTKESVTVFTWPQPITSWHFCNNFHSTIFELERIKRSDTCTSYRIYNILWSSLTPTTIPHVICTAAQ